MELFLSFVKSTGAFYKIVSDTYLIPPKVCSRSGSRMGGSGGESDMGRDNETNKRLRRLHHLEMSVLRRSCMQHASGENDIPAC